MSSTFGLRIMPMFLALQALVACAAPSSAADDEQGGSSQAFTGSNERVVGRQYDESAGSWFTVHLSGGLQPIAYTPCPNRALPNVPDPCAPKDNRGTATLRAEYDNGGTPHRVAVELRLEDRCGGAPFRTYASTGQQSEWNRSTVTGTVRGNFHDCGPNGHDYQLAVWWGVWGLDAAGNEREVASGNVSLNNEAR